MSKPSEYTDNFKSNLTCIFLCQGQIKKNTALGHCSVYVLPPLFGNLFVLNTYKDKLDKDVFFSC